MTSHLSSKPAIGIFILVLSLLTIVSTTVAFNKPIVLLNENQILYLFSTSAQVIAAIYGLTLTGFIFFRNELSREESEDETLEEAVEALKARYFHFLIFITVIVSLTVILANMAIALESSNRSHLNALVINAGQSSFLVSLAAIAYFIFDVVAPRRIERASMDLQNKIDPFSKNQAKGSLEDFLKSYNQIEKLLSETGRTLLKDDPNDSTPHFRRHFSNARLAELLLRREVIDKPLFEKVRELIALRNSIIHGAELVVSKAIVDATDKALRDLKAAIENGHGEPR